MERPSNSGFMSGIKSAFTSKLSFRSAPTNVVPSPKAKGDESNSTASKKRLSREITIINPLKSKKRLSKSKKQDIAVIHQANNCSNDETCKEQEEVDSTKQLDNETNDMVVIVDTNADITDTNVVVLDGGERVEEQAKTLHDNQNNETKETQDSIAESLPITTGKDKMLDNTIPPKKTEQNLDGSTSNSCCVEDEIPPALPPRSKLLGEIIMRSQNKISTPNAMKTLLSDESESEESGKGATNKVHASPALTNLIANRAQSSEPPQTNHDNLLAAIAAGPKKVVASPALEQLFVQKVKSLPMENPVAKDITLKPEPKEEIPKKSVNASPALANLFAQKSQALSPSKNTTEEPKKSVNASPALANLFAQKSQALSPSKNTTEEPKKSVNASPALANLFAQKSQALPANNKVRMETKATQTEFEATIVDRSLRTTQTNITESCISANNESSVTIQLIDLSNAPDPPPMPPPPERTGPGNKGIIAKPPNLPGMRPASCFSGAETKPELHASGSSDTTPNKPADIPEPPPMPPVPPKTGPGNQGIYPPVPDLPGMRPAHPTTMGHVAADKKDVGNESTTHTPVDIPEPPPMPPAPPKTGPGNQGKYPPVPDLPGMRLAHAKATPSATKSPSPVVGPPTPPPMPPPPPKTGPGNGGIIPKVPELPGIRVAGPAPGIKATTKNQPPKNNVKQPSKQPIKAKPVIATKVVSATPDIPERFRGRRKSTLSNPEDIGELRGIFWKVIHPSKVEHTIWASLPDEAPVSMDKHVSILSACFAKKKAHDMKAKLQRKESTSNDSENDETGSKADDCALRNYRIDGKRQQNLGIALARMRQSIPDLKKAIVEMDDSVLSGELVHKILTLVPNSEEIEMTAEILRQEKECSCPGHSDFNFSNVDFLTKAELFVLELSSINRLQQRLQCASVEVSFQQQSQDLMIKIKRFMEGCKQLKMSAKLHKLLHIVLCCGNVVNEGNSQRAGAWGFEITTGLPKLAHCKANGDGKYTLLHWIAEVVHAQMPELLELDKELDKVQGCLMLDINELKTDLNQLKKGFELVKKEIDANKQSINSTGSEAFVKAMEPFVKDVAAPLMEGAKVSFSDLEKGAEEMVRSFGEDPRTCSAKKLFESILGFTKSLFGAHEANIKKKEKLAQEMNPRSPSPMKKRPGKLSSNINNKLKGEMLDRKIKCGKLRNSLGRGGIAALKQGKGLPQKEQQHAELLQVLNRMKGKE